MKDKSIGGYFELELPKYNNVESPISDGVHVNSGRHALEFIIKSLNSKAKHVWVPYFTCDVIYQHLNKIDINFSLYHTNKQLEIDQTINFKDGDYIIVNNYFGIKDQYIKNLSSNPLYKNRMIIDNAQAWYAKPIIGFNSFYSPRKFFGVPDGGIAISTGQYQIKLHQGFSTKAFQHLIKRIDYGAKEGYADFQTNSNLIEHEDLNYMSNLTSRLLDSIDYELVKNKRLRNYKTLHDALGRSNLLQLPNDNTFECPMVYPYMTDDNNLRKHLIENEIFVATYWPNVLETCQSHTIEYNLAKNIIPLPIDQRYGRKEMERIIEVISH